MRKRTRWIIGGAMAAVVVAGAGTGIAVAAGEDDDAYEVEVTLDGGRQVDVHLDGDLRVLSSEPDGEDDGGEDDD